MAAKQLYGAERATRSGPASAWRAVLAGAVALASSALVAAAPGISHSGDPESLPLAGAAPTRSDPLRGFNRRSFAFNSVLDRVLIGPVARGYRRIVPGPLRRGLGNAVANLREPATVINAALQGRPKVATRATARFVANSTVGLLGLFDVAGKGGLERQPADLGQTLGRYGVAPGPYIYLPVVGPTTVRDGIGSVVSLLGDPVSHATGGPATEFATSRSVVRGLNARADNDATLKAVMEESTDPYATVRSSYLQNRAALVREATGAEEVLPEFEPSDPQSDPAAAPPEAPATLTPTQP